MNMTKHPRPPYCAHTTALLRDFVLTSVDFQGATNQLALELLGRGWHGWLGCHPSLEAGQACSCLDKGMVGNLSCLSACSNAG